MSPEVKTGLEAVLGFLDQTGTLGRIYYKEHIGSSGTKACGVGTKVNSGSRTVHVGSGLVFCSGKVKEVAINNTGTFAAAASTGSVICYNIEVGSDATVDIVAGTQNTTVAYAIQVGAGSRAGSQAGHAPLAYLTVTDDGTLLAGSIVDDRTFATSTALSYRLGENFDWTESPLHIYDGTTYDHSKPQRGVGKFSYKCDLVQGTDSDAWAGCEDAGHYMTVNRVALELDYKGIAGTTEMVNLLINAVKETEAYDHPEETQATADFGGFYGSLLRY